MGVRGLGTDSLEGIIKKIIRQNESLDRRVTAIKEWLQDRYALTDHDHDFEIDVESEGVLVGAGSALNFSAGDNVDIGVTDTGSSVLVAISASSGTTIVNTSSREYVLVAAFDASQELKDMADFTCDGVDDQLEIIEATNTGLKVRFTYGTFNITTDSFISVTQWQGWTEGVISPFPGSAYTNFVVTLSGSSFSVFDTGLGNVFDSINVNVQASAFTLSQIIHMDAAVVTNSVFIVNAIDALTDAFIATTAFDPIESNTIRNCKFFYNDPGLDFPFPAIHVLTDNVHIDTIKCVGFDAPAVLLDGSTALGNTISNISHLSSSTPITPTFNYVVEDNSLDAGTGVNAINCASFACDQYVNGVSPSNVCSDPFGTLPESS